MPQVSALPATPLGAPSPGLGTAELLGGTAQSAGRDLLTPTVPPLHRLILIPLLTGWVVCPAGAEGLAWSLPLLVARNVSLAVAVWSWPVPPPHLFSLLLGGGGVALRSFPPAGSRAESWASHLPSANPLCCRLSILDLIVAMAPYTDEPSLGALYRTIQPSLQVSRPGWGWGGRGLGALRGPPGCSTSGSPIPPSLAAGSPEGAWLPTPLPGSGERSGSAARGSLAAARSVERG